MTFEECELAILRTQVDQVQKKIAKRIIQSDDLTNIIQIVEQFLKTKKLVCYGGTAINNILPKKDQFYDKSVEMADYDFFTANAVKDAKELADVYASKGFTEVEAKAGQHFGTYKVFVNFIPVADVTSIPMELFTSLQKEAIRKDGILYAPPNFLRMSMYLELSRPAGDTDRWEKVMKRLGLLNKSYPLTIRPCNKIQIQRDTRSIAASRQSEVYDIIKDVFVDEGVVFFGGFAMSMYSKHIPSKIRNSSKFSDFDVISHAPEKTSDKIKAALEARKIKKVKIIKQEPVGELIPTHYEIVVNKDTVAFVYEPIACHSYNVISLDREKIKVATIDTILSFYLAFLYTDRTYYNMFLDRILCIAEFLFKIQQQNRLAQRGVLKRFSINCYGHQPSIEEIRANKSKMFKKLSGARAGAEYEAWFLSYSPSGKSSKKSGKSNPKSTRTRTRTRTRTKANRLSSRSKSKSKTKKKRKP